jgi:glutathionyl-hydroquinone reductase
MGKLIDGVWHSTEEQTRIGAGGDFVRGTTKFRDRVAADGSTPFAPEAGRYHLWVAHNCPWAHRAIIVRNLEGLQDAIGMTVAHFRRSEEGWWFPEGLDDLAPVDGRFAAHRLYSQAASDYTGSATVPVLWDRAQRTIVSNESAEIIRMLDTEFHALARTPVDLQPADRVAEIEGVNDWVYAQINNGVYRAGFARTQEAYERGYHDVFDGLERAEARLGRHRYLVGDTLTLADVRLFTTLARFDAVYFSHFKCNKRRISDFPNLSGYFRDLYQTPGIGETVKVELYKRGYYGRSPGLNPRGIIPLGPSLDFDAPHDRGTREYG